jgi:enediyne biosynthesis protein E4
VVNYVDARLDNNVFCGNAVKQVRDYCHPLNFKPLANTLYRNNGNGTFTDVSRESGVGALRGNGLGVVIGDYDDDGWPDVFVANDTTPNILLHNTGKGTFVDAALMAGVSVASDGKPRAGMGTDFGTWTATGISTCS